MHNINKYGLTKDLKFSSLETKSSSKTLGCWTRLLMNANNTAECCWHMMMYWFGTRWKLFSSTMSAAATQSRLVQFMVMDEWRKENAAPSLIEFPTFQI